MHVFVMWIAKDAKSIHEDNKDQSDCMDEQADWSF